MDGCSMACHVASERGLRARDSRRRVGPEPDPRREGTVSECECLHCI